MIQPVIDVHVDADFMDLALRADVAEGLTSQPKELPPKWFYDDRGSELFEQITGLPEYYPTRREREILERRVDEIAEEVAADTIVELGSGSSRKTRLLLDAFSSSGQLERFMPFDTSETILRESAAEVAASYPGLQVHGVIGDFEHHLDHIPAGGRRMVVLLGGTIGNFTPARRKAFLAEVTAGMLPGDTFLMGADLVKDETRLLAAYDDSQGITAAFNLNLLSVINQRLGADFNLDAFEHMARFNPDEERMEMWLRSCHQQKVRIRDLELTVDFVEGEAMRTEISDKFRPEQIGPELAAVGLELQHLWTDDAGDYCLTLSRLGGRSADPPLQ